MSKSATSKSTETTQQIVLAGHPTKIPPGVKVVNKLTSDQVYVSEPIRESYSIKGQAFVNYNSRGGFVDEEGKVYDLFLRFPKESFCYLSYQREMGAPRDDTTMDKVKGAQLSYSLIGDLQSPTKEEKDNVASLKAIYDKVVEKSHIFHDNDKLPDNVAGMFSQSLKKTKSCKSAVKPFSAPKKNKEGKIQTDKAEVMYIKLVTKGKGNEIKISTRFYNEKGREADPRTLIGTALNSEPCVKFDGVYWGSHGTTAYGASLKFLVVEANISPSEGTSKLPTVSLLGNTRTSKYESDESDSEGEGDGGVSASSAEGFHPPEEDGPVQTTTSDVDDPVETLSASTKKSKKESSKNTPQKTKSTKTKKASSDDDEPKPVLKKKAQPKHEESDDDEEPPKASSKSKKKTTKKKAVPKDEDDDE